MSERTCVICGKPIISFQDGWKFHPDETKPGLIEGAAGIGVAHFKCKEQSHD